MPHFVDGTDEWERCPSVIISQLRDLEKKFFELVEVGDVRAVRAFVEAHANFNINAIDHQGTSALHIAVRERNIPMVEYILSDPNIDPGDAHLHAILDNQTKITMLILNKLNKLSPGFEFAGVTGSCDFPEDATPLAVAAQCGRFELIGMLKNRNHVLTRPHPSICICEDCREDRKNGDALMVEKMRLFIYEAITNPAYIVQEVEDPILEAFNLSFELARAASFDRQFYHTYKSLSNNVGQFATDLIDCARTTYEVETILEQPAGLPHSSKFTYPRLLLALYYNQKTFVAHPHVQQIVENKWIGGWYEWKIMKTWQKCMWVIPRIFMLPIIVIVLLFAPNLKKAKSWQSPVNKFLSSVASYIIFLIVVFLQSNSDKTMQLRGPPTTVYIWVLVIYTIAYLFSTLHICIMHGPKKYFKTPWYWFEIIMVLFFVLTILFWIAAARDVTVNGQLELERKYWHQYDPTLVGEGMYALSTCLAFLKTMFYCQLNYQLGPLQLALGKMTKDVAKFIVYFAIILLAFTASLCKFYQYYEGMVQVDDESKIKIQQVNSFIDIKSTIKTLFWAVFCLSPIESADVVIENLPGDTDMETIINHHTFTEAIGYISFAIYHFISVIVVLNMLIACMSDTFAKITKDVIVEWTFGRTKVYVDFMVSTTLPPPFNIIPTLGGIKSVVEYLKILIKPPIGKRARWDFSHCFYIENIKTKKDEKFSRVMATLVQRYFAKKSKETTHWIGENDRLKNEIVKLQNLLKDAMSTD